MQRSIDRLLKATIEDSKNAESSKEKKIIEKDGKISLFLPENRKVVFDKKIRISGYAIDYDEKDAYEKVMESKYYTMNNGKIWFYQLNFLFEHNLYCSN